MPLFVTVRSRLSPRIRSDAHPAQTYKLPLMYRLVIMPPMGARSLHDPSCNYTLLTSSNPDRLRHRTYATNQCRPLRWSYRCSNLEMIQSEQSVPLTLALSDRRDQRSHWAWALPMGMISFPYETNFVVEKQASAGWPWLFIQNNPSHGRDGQGGDTIRSDCPIVSKGCCLT
ncbi:MAG: hypothetical protein K0S45_974 [Nitrospira sp.]|jgi:hypothetical protein|nr:hypothetical protein [Nitrospira sp.]